ncbi:MAG: DUF4166 domain-containing protein [Pseudomonadota bacterium]
MSLAPFQRALGASWANLPPSLQEFHRSAEPRIYQGQADITRGQNQLARLIASLFRFPPAGRQVPVTVTITPDGDGEIWARQFATHQLRSHIHSPKPGEIVERFGPFAFTLPLELTEDGLSLPVAYGSILGLPLPKALLPRSEAKEIATPNGFRFDIRLSLPLLGLMVHYQGSLTPQEDRK